MAKTTNKPVVFVLFGSTGDLAKNRLVPGLVNLWMSDILPPKFKFLAVGRSKLTTSEYIDSIAQEKTPKYKQEVQLLQPEYVQVDFATPGGFANLWKKLNKLGDDYRIVYYLAVGPEVMHTILDRFEDNIGSSAQHGREAAVLVEKPFGDCLADAKRLNGRFAAIFTHPFVLRNDHYLKKDRVQEISTKRREDIYFESVLNAEHVREIQLLVSEQVDLGGRTGYFEQRGMLIDWLQSHMLQVLAVLCANTNTDNFNSAKADFIRSLELVPDSIIRGQYQGYTLLDGADPDSTTETFLAVQLESKDIRWQGVVFKLVSGKALDRKEVSVNIKLNKAHPHFGEEIKLPIDSTTGDAFEETIVDAINIAKDKFVTAPEVEAQWLVTDQIREQMQNSPLEIYAKGTSYKDFCTKSQKWCASI